MKTPTGVAIAVRQPDGAIAVRDRPWQSLTQRVRPLGWPFLRGIVVLVESLREGIDGLRFSAEVAVGDEPEGEKRSDKGSGKFSANLALLLGVLIAIVLFKAIPHYIALWLGLSPTETLFHVVDGAVKLTLVVGYIAAISRMKDIQRVFMYHGAEHKSIRAFEEGAVQFARGEGNAATVDATSRHKVAGEQLVEAAASYSRLHERCGTSFIIVVVIASVLVYIAASPLIPRGINGGILFQAALIGAKILLLGPVAAIAYEINRLAGKYWRSPFAKLVSWPGLLMQKLLTTREPSPDQLEVALSSLLIALSHPAAQGAGAGSKPSEWRLRRFPDFEAIVEATADGAADRERSEAE